MSSNIITKETKITQSITDTNLITTNYVLPNFNTNKIIFRDPLQYQRGHNIISLTNTFWNRISPSFSSTFYEISSRSGDLFYIMVEKDEESFYIKQTISDSYNNSKLPVRISIANGTFDYDSVSNTFTQNANSKEIIVDYIILQEKIT